MLLDIGIPCFNEASNLKQCLQSIDLHFQDNYQDIKVWVIDDDSLYGNAYQEVIAQFNHHFIIQYIKMEKNSGPGPCRNVVIAKGEAPWITFIDDDDIVINNPLKQFKTINTNADLIKSIVTNGKGKECAQFNSFWTGCWGTIFNRNYLCTHNFQFFEPLGIIGTEDSVFTMITTACSDNIQHIDSFIVHQERDNSQYHLNSSSLIMHYGLSLLNLCNICEALIQYRKYIQDFNIVWKAMSQQYQQFFKQPAPANPINLHFYTHYVILFYLIFFKAIHLAFPTSEDIKKVLTTNDDEFFPAIYCAYHFCDNIDDNTLYYNYKKQSFLTEQNFIPELSHEDMFYTLHFPSIYAGLIQYPGLKLVKDNRRKRGLPEKYWNF